MSDKKHISFNPYVKIHHLHVWTYAYQKNRKDGKMWINAAIDRNRFQKRCKEISCILDLSNVFDIEKRKTIYIERFK